MKPAIKNLFIFLAAVAVGMVVNMAIVMISGFVVPLPIEVDVMDPEALKAAIPLFEPKHFVMPFLAHALGTLAGAYMAARFTSNKQIGWAGGVGVVFLLGGIANLQMLPMPVWFATLDLVAAYIPMGWLGAKLALRK